MRRGEEANAIYRGLNYDRRALSGNRREAGSSDHEKKTASNQRGRVPQKQAHHDAASMVTPRNTGTTKIVRPGTTPSPTRHQREVILINERPGARGVPATQGVRPRPPNTIPVIGKPAPYFKAPAVLGMEMKDLSLDDFKGKFLILMFYPADFTFVCPTEVIAFSDALDEFHKLNCEVVACSTDTQYSHLAWQQVARKEGGLGMVNMPLLSDRTQSISKSYGVLDEATGNSFRGLFIIDEKQRLRQIVVNDMGVGRDTLDTLRIVLTIQAADKGGYRSACDD
ncbi:unnamed protein product [Cyprideis torosa]|uniref:thioredoxin-dependent peroxiredoxin n=1 Tax=Cyprideis torosa TaxID=163714 RepID=A0A7R8W6M4_9CRUS|nr:unnamed protein product [Cyprideis torosa]CAG0885385.1 unnamed protein product [Cyprideis torosa]